MSQQAEAAAIHALLERQAGGALKTPLGGTVLSPDFSTHPVRLYPNPEPASWKLLKKVGYDDSVAVFEGQTEDECIAFFKANVV